MKKKRVAIIGTNGIPARYGGFETLAENLVNQLSKDFEFFVYCSTIYSKNERKKKYHGARLLYVPIKANGIQSLFYDLFSFLHAAFRVNTILLLGPTPSGIIVLLNLFFRKKFIINHGGLNEWERTKYSSIERRWAYINHKIAAKFATLNISDNTILQDSIRNSFGVESIVIRYGGIQNFNEILEAPIKYNYDFMNAPYALCVARAQIDNNIHMLIEAFEKGIKIPLVIISNWTISEYGKDIWNKKDKYNNIIILDAIYDIKVLNYIRASCSLYIHSHSFCGTAPSLVEAMSLNIPIICFDVPTNRETTENRSRYFFTSQELYSLVESLSEVDLEKIRRDMFSIANRKYTWPVIADQYRKIL